MDPYSQRHINGCLREVPNEPAFLRSFANNISMIVLNALICTRNSITFISETEVTSPFVQYVIYKVF